MSVSRRQFVAAASASIPFVLLGGHARAQTATTLKISHQFPGGSGDEGDFRDVLCRKFAAEIEKRTKGALKAQVYAGSSLMKTNAQFSAMRKGALDLSFYPLPYAGGEIQETNIGLMPGLIPSYEQAAQWKNAEVGKLLDHLWTHTGRAGEIGSSCAARGPSWARGCRMKIRGEAARWTWCGTRAPGASLPSNEIYAAMQTGAMDASAHRHEPHFSAPRVSAHLPLGAGGRTGSCASPS
jgi:TRAP-type C4-dicarboxylate transport system substrate-binding protein